MTNSDELNQKMYQTILLLTNQFIKDEGIREEIVSEATIKAIEGVGKLRNPDALEAWLAKIVRNELRMWKRREQKEISTTKPIEELTKEEFGQLKTEGPGLEGDMWGLNQDYEAVLSSKERKVLALKLDGLSEREIAKKLEISRKRVWMICESIREKILTRA